MLQLLIIAAAIAILLAIAFFIIGQNFGRKSARKDLEQTLSQTISRERRDAIDRSRAVLSGQFSEQLAPYLPDFNHNPTEARFIGKPVDFIIFKGSENQSIEEVVFVEVKSGNSRLTSVERSLRDAINEGRVSYEEYRVPEDLTRKPLTI